MTRGTLTGSLLLLLVVSVPLTAEAGGAGKRDGTLIQTDVFPDDEARLSPVQKSDLKTAQKALAGLSGDIDRLNEIVEAKELSARHVRALRKHVASVRRNARIVSDYAHRSGNTSAADLSDRILIDDDVLGKMIINDDILGKKIINDDVTGKQIINDDVTGKQIINDDVTGKLLINDDITGRKADIERQIKTLTALTSQLKKTGLAQSR